MDKLFAKRMDELVPSGIRKVNEKALAMERAGETVIHFELGRPDFDTPEYIKNACIEDIKKRRCILYFQLWYHGAAGGDCLEIKDAEQCRVQTD